MNLKNIENSVIILDTGESCVYYIVPIVELIPYTEEGVF